MRAALDEKVCMDRLQQLQQAVDDKADTATEHKAAIAQLEEVSIAVGTKASLEQLQEFMRVAEAKCEKVTKALAEHVGELRAALDEKVGMDRLQQLQQAV